MTHSTQTQPIKVSREDAMRLARLTEEVSGRVVEMAHIVGRNLGLPPQRLVGQFTLVQGIPDVAGPHLRFDNTAPGNADVGEPSDDEIEIIIVPPGGCYDVEQQVCCMAPCPPC